MSVPTQNIEWEQGEDAEINLIYKEKVTPDDVAVPVDLTGYSVRMDIAKQSDGTRVWTFNSSDNAGAPPIDVVGTADNEASLNSDGEIYILIPRSLTLPGGEVFVAMQSGILVFKYDLFLRNPAGKQKKLLSGDLIVNPSVTLWA